MTMTNLYMMRGAAFALMLSPVAACAQPAHQRAPAGGQSDTAPGGATLEAFVQQRETKLMAADTNGDGKVSRAEFIAAAKDGKADPATRFAKIDRNGDGMLDKSEVDAMLTRRFQRLDTNADGILSREERAAAHARKTGADGSGG
jgi:hypothetical protein